MSYCRKEGKDEIIFLTKDDFSSQEQAKEEEKAAEEEEPVGLIFPNGDINWDCPCLQGMGNGPCGQDFKDAFSCFHYSEAEPKGSDCFDSFKGMQDCFLQHPEVYGSLDDDDDNADSKVTNDVSESKSDVTESANDVIEIGNEKVEVSNVAETSNQLVVVNTSLDEDELSSSNAEQEV